jgi:hypothetical protein
MLDYYPAPWANNVWTPWVKHIMGHAEDCGVQQAAMVKHKKQQTVACSKKFVPSTADIQSMTLAMEDKTIDRIRVKDKTYTLLPRSFTSDPLLLVGSNADKYVVIGCSSTMYIVVQIKRGSRPTEGSERVRRTLELVKKVTTRLTNNDY